MTPAHLVVGLLQEAGVDLHLTRQHGVQFGGHVVPGGDFVVALGEFGILRHHAQLLLLLQRPLAKRVPAIVELALVLVGPLLGDVVRCVGGTGSEVHEERLVRHQRLLLAHPGDRAVGEILGEGVALLR